MKLVVCGCSWSSIDPTFPNTEYGHFISEHFGWDYQNIARVGGSNFAIRLQIDYAVKNLNPDFIVVNWTTPCRIDWNHTGKRYLHRDGLKQMDYDVDKFFDNKRSHPCKDYDPRIISQSVTGIYSLDNLNRTYQQEIQFWPELEHHMSEDQFNAFRKYYPAMYDDEIESHKQYYMMESAVHQMNSAGIKYLFCPNTFEWKQSYQDIHKIDHEASKDEIYIYYDWEFVNSVNLCKNGIANALAWDFETMEDPVNHPTHDHCHHLSEYAQKRWATEVAIPQISKILD